MAPWQRRQRCFPLPRLFALLVLIAILIGWLEGPNVKVPAVNVLVRKGNPGYNSTEAERTFQTRDESEWPLRRTKYTDFNLMPDRSMSIGGKAQEETTLEYEALTGEPISFATAPFEQETEICGHITANLVMGVSTGSGGQAAPKDLDVMVTLRHFDASGQEVYYTGNNHLGLHVKTSFGNDVWLTGTAGDNVPLCKGFLRASLRKIDTSNPRHRDYLPYRRYSSEDEELLEADKPYDLLVEVWPTSVVVSKGGRLVFEVISIEVSRTLHKLRNL